MWNRPRSAILLLADGHLGGFLLFAVTVSAAQGPFLLLSAGDTSKSVCYAHLGVKLLDYAWSLRPQLF